ncbi:MAG TPA: PAS domain S-box protein, partial [Burkholderiales bacterium]|nr:PAS domain S-box protein [Burkholderiales bacterium]
MATRRKRARPLLTGLSSDWYWEQDASLRFVRVQVQAGTPGEQELASKSLGRRPWETGIFIEGGWDAHRALLKKRAPFREVLMWRELDDGSRRYISASGEPRFDARGRFAGYRGVGRDITRQKRGELLLRLQHTVIRRLAEAADAVQATEGALRAVCETESWDVGHFWRLDPAAQVIRRFAHWVVPGVSAARRFSDALRDVDFAPGVGLVGAAWQSAQPMWIPDSTMDARARRKALAEETGLRGSLLCPIQIDGSVVGVLGFDCRKIRPPDEALLEALTAIGTQLALYLRRAGTEAALRHSEERFRRTFELAGSGVAHLGLDRRFLRVNRKLCDILGYPESELIDRSVLEVSHPMDVERTNAQRDRLYAGEIDSVSMEKRYRRKDGRVVWAALTLALERDADGKPQYEIAVFDDITARKAAEAAMRESEERFRRTFELAGSGVAHVDVEGRYLRVNRRLCEMFGYDESELVGRPAKALSHPDDRDLTDAERARMYRGECDVARSEKRYLRKDGSTLWVNMSLALERDPAGTPLYEISVLDDISARKAAEHALRDSEARFRSLTALSSDWFWEQDAEFRFTRLEGRNVAGGDRKTRDEVIGTHCWDDAALQVEGGWDAYRRVLEARGRFQDVLMWRRTSAGATRYVRISGEPVFDADARFIGYRGVGRDVTAQKQAEESLRESEARFRNTFELAGVGVAARRPGPRAGGPARAPRRGAARAVRPARRRPEPLPPHGCVWAYARGARAAGRARGRGDGRAARGARRA